MDLSKSTIEKLCEENQVRVIKSNGVFSYDSLLIAIDDFGTNQDNTLVIRYCKDTNQIGRLFTRRFNQAGGTRLSGEIESTHTGKLSNDMMDAILNAYVSYNDGLSYKYDDINIDTIIKYLSEEKITYTSIQLIDATMIIIKVSCKGCLFMQYNDNVCVYANYSSYKSYSNYAHTSDLLQVGKFKCENHLTYTTLSATAARDIIDIFSNKQNNV